MKTHPVPHHSRGSFVLRLLIALALFPATGIAADEAAPPAPNRIQIQGGRGIQVQVGGGNLQVIGNAAVAVADAKPRLAEIPMIFLPSFPFHLLPHLTFEKEAEPGYLGVQLEVGPGEDGEAADPKDKEQAKKNQGVGILSVMDDSPAAKAGIKEGDRVLAVGGKAVKDSTELRETIRAAKADRDVKLTVRRDGKEIEVKARLGAFPAEQAVVQFNVQNGQEAVPGIVIFNNKVIGNIVRSSTSSNASGTQGAASETDSVSLRDGNRFTGRIQGIDPVKGLILRRESGPDLELLEEGISSVSFAKRGTDAPAASEASLQLRDGSFFTGEKLTMDGGKILLILNGGQRLEFPREDVSAVTLSDGNAAQIYEGPMGLAGWSAARSGQGNWEYKDGFLRCLSNGPIGRNFERMPDPLDLSFEVNYPAPLHHFGITLFGLGVNQSNTGTLSVQFSPNQISGNHFDGRRYNQYNAAIKPDGARFDGASATIRYRLLVDRVNGRALIFVNGVKRADWKLSKVKAEDIGKCGGYFSITPNVFSSTSTFRVGRIRVLPWDGVQPADGAETPEPKTDRFLRSDGKSIDARVERITDQEILFGNQVPAAPRKETIHVRFAPPKDATPDAPPAVAFLRLTNGSEFAAKEVQGSGVALTLTTRSGSQITLPLTVLRDLEYLSRPGKAEPSASGSSVLTLVDGTQLKGALFSPLDGGKVRWKIAASTSPLDFQQAEIAGVLFSPMKGSEKASPLRGASAVRLSNGDWLPGDVVSLDANHLVLKSDLAPDLSFPVTEVRSLFLSPEVTATVADGATGPELWSKGWNPNTGFTATREIKRTQAPEESWLYFDGSYTLKSNSRIGNAAIGRKWRAYPGPYALNFDVENPGRSSSFTLQLFNSKEERTFTVHSFGGRVNAYFNPSSARMNRLAGPAKRFQADGAAKPDAKMLRICVVLDRPGKTFRVMLDGKEIGKIAFKQEEASEALEVGGVSITPMASGMPGARQNRIARIWIAPYTGPEVTASEAVESEKPATPIVKADAPLPTLHLSNGDEFTGKIEGIDADLLTVNSDAGLLELPRERVAWLDFPGTAATSPGGFPRLRFHDRGALSIQDLHIENDRVKCRTLQGHALDFPLSVVKEVVYRAVIQK